MTSLTFLRMRRCGTAADSLPRRREIFPNMGAHHADIRVHRDKYSYHNDTFLPVTSTFRNVCDVATGETRSMQRLTGHAETRRDRSALHRQRRIDRSRANRLTLNFA
ncbi:hypothetical protein [Burkholderia multivorans]|uniref:hypothetical protein n=1 Tax=Burkholderia multivorans TaxID=87883 RepID=UPI0021BE0880|nr:hypothetical protein [Burkholderia multivorans]